MDSNQRVLKAIEEIKKGNMVVMIDDEDRENEGDLVYASTFTTPQKVNFMIKEARGVVCAALNKKIATRLGLNLMVNDNSSQHETAFTVSVDAKEATTGVSAVERDMTIKILADYNSKASDLVRPGHIFPLIAKDGGVLVRTGHTEGSVDLCNIAGITQVATICEIVKDDGDMARRDDLDKFCKKHNLHIVYVADLVKYRIENESLIRVIAEANTNFMNKPARRYDIVDHKDRHHIAYTFGKIRNKSNVKFHTILNDHDLFSNPTKFNGLTKAIEYLQENNGIIIFMGVDENNNSQMKEFGIGAQILRYLGVRELVLLAASKEREFVGLKGFNLHVTNQILF